MKLAFCVACAATDNLHHHHLIPRVAGGSDDESNLITLCGECHFSLHERRRSDGYNHSRLTSAGLAAAKARGVRLGKPKGYQIPSDTKTRAKGVAAIRANAADFAERLRPVLAELAELSANATAAELDRRGIATARGGKWEARSVIALRGRLAASREQ